MPVPFLAPRAWSIRARLVLLVLSVWLPAVVAFALVARGTYEREEGAARGRMREAAEMLNAQIEGELEKCAVLARALSASAALRDHDIPRFHAEARAAALQSPGWVFLVDREQQLANTLLPAPRTLPRLPATPFVESGAPRVMFAASGPVLRKPVIAVFVPESGVRPPRFNVGVSLETSILQNLLARDHAIDALGVVASAVDEAHQVVARSRDPERWVGRPASGVILQRLQSRQAGFGTSVTLDGVSSLSYVSRPNRYGWTVVTALPQANLQATARRLTVQASIASGVLLTIGLLLAVFAARRIARPLGALEASAAALGRQQVPALLRTGLSEADAVAAAMHDAGERLEASGRVLQERVQEAVQQAQQAQQAQLRLLEAQKHEAIGRLTGGIAHDFNNLLQTISMALHVVDKSVPTGTHARALGAARNACSKAADLVRQMLAFGRTQPLQPQPVDLRDFLLRHEEFTRKAVGERVRLTADVQAGVQAVQADPTQLELAVLNLVFNARDAMPAGGHIALRARLARAEECADLGPGPFVCLEVSDDGPGIAPELQARVFEPYFTTKPVGAGSGLGLAQVLAFARRSGGDVRLASAPGRGATFTLLLPACAQGVDDGVPRSEATAGGAPLHVLMVEDDVLVSSVVEPALLAEGHSVTLCASGDEALVLLRAGGDYDVVFTDVVMPGGMSGIDLAQWCAAHRPHLPVVVATGYSAQQLDPAFPVLRKPYTMGALLDALRQAQEAPATAAG